jgi:hypothetical protein
MADNVTVGANTFASDDIGGVQYPRTKLSVGADGAATDVSTAAPLPAKLTDGTNAVAVKAASTAAAATDPALVVAVSPNAGLALDATLTGGTAAVIARGPVAHDGASTGAPLLQGGYASAAAPSDVSADGDAVRAWHLRNGAQCVNITAAGALIPGDATVGLRTACSGGTVAHDAADSGNPVKIGGKAANALPTAVANADRADSLTDLWGRQLQAHIDPAMQIRKSFNATSTQTGAAVWTPASGKKIAITSVQIGAYGSTSSRLILWFGASGDTTYTEGTDDAVIKQSFAPSANGFPGIVFAPAVPYFHPTADDILRVTTDAAMSVDIVVTGYEF